MKKVALFLAGLGFCSMSQAEEPVKNFYFAGYKAVFIPSDTFRVEVGNPEMRIRKLKDRTCHSHLKMQAERCRKMWCISILMTFTGSV